MALDWKESTWMDGYRAASKRRRASAWRRMLHLSNDLREPLDAAVVIGVICGAAVLLAYVFPL